MSANPKTFDSFKATLVVDTEPDAWLAKEHLNMPVIVYDALLAGVEPIGGQLLLLSGTAPLSRLKALADRGVPESNLRYVDLKQDDLGAVISRPSFLAARAVPPPA